jgi:hypothetical protein
MTRGAERGCAEALTDGATMHKLLGCEIDFAAEEKTVIPQSRMPAVARARAN